jgi:hypothetical protein
MGDVPPLHLHHLQEVSAEPLQISSGNKGKRASYVPIPTASVLSQPQEAKDPLSKRIVTVLNYAADFVVAAIQYLFIAAVQPKELLKTQQMGWEHFDIYTREFNKQPENRALFLSSTFSQIERGGLDWNTPSPPSKKPFFTSLIENCIDDHQGLKQYRENIWESPGMLREALTSVGKDLLALPLNLEKSKGEGGRHWTVVHIDFKTRTIAYLDSFKPNPKADEVKMRLEQMLTWITKIDGEGWRIATQSNSQPSILSENKQYNQWDCGVFAIHFTKLVGEGKSHEDIDKISFSDMYKQIAQCRCEIIETIRRFLRQTT